MNRLELRDIEGWMDLHASVEFQSNSRGVYDSLNDKEDNQTGLDGIARQDFCVNCQGVSFFP